MLQNVCTKGGHFLHHTFQKNKNIEFLNYVIMIANNCIITKCTRDVQAVCGLTMKENRYKVHSLYKNTTGQYKNIDQEEVKKSDLFAILARHP